MLAGLGFLTLEGERQELRLARKRGLQRSNHFPLKKNWKHSSMR